jgi:hypothetical protein
VDRPRAADDFATIRARMEELRREREGGCASQSELQSGPPRHDRTERSLPGGLANKGTGPVRQPGSGAEVDRAGPWYARRRE